MNKRFQQLSLILVCIFIFNAPFFALGQSEDYLSTRTNQEIKEINNDILSKKGQIQKIQEQQEKYSALINQKQSEKATLNNQVAILDNRLAKAELDIEIVRTEIDRTQLEIQKTDLEIEDKNKTIDTEKKHISNVLKLINKNDNVSTLEIMLLNDSFANFLSQAKYLEDVSEDVKTSLDKLNDLKKELLDEKNSLKKQNTDLDELKIELEEKQKELSEEKESKGHILEQVKESEKTYQILLAQAKKEQQEASAEIASMEKLVRAKLANLEGKKLEFNDNGMIWPVPRNTITSYFHDPDYPFRNIFEHPAIDIRAGQGTVLKAAASGYVARVKEGVGGSYGYIMLIHGDGLSTVYGHVSKIYVEEDEYIVQGQTIGLTGGLPGTPGSGALTTGPHLHFEVRLNGIPVNPLNYLN
ncbi:hypothetical protein A2331_06365 [Candidatus Falkowbacteria bacterium RIFOXYB2_FULL_34_18]|uniref:M23ase beta-sheet core domain-containing protein n=1 Tax=Candidatus Falkowbacteria bacterium RIFOXYD2_FULL_34_120 TaxID=1798007 RepID=A0A1F5TQ31_9BACT|nr:MAG: hypothetical protein A2331_06365 [Candidatus Falkowbacteria bacterium RIFOXYB2_FULL_34_18]OGF29393.1 MAG: hypothetical protein A2500_06455 [Candidatus Falkowbacteria bacterium RIFOXYC12_FULL_34_55]OGF36602.1 MAG: hypothetical protein A2466_06790 [Candidatus Falkowbacteria bacterium RIFOXYC2_FULL_34_220]OGF38820.1 MAG: hypothetical protein A2515_03235 [Candidatus Falkowbacteria bacterium RIFOXYD12_FULL_34_57]OGF41075.1 MAG: hypothetical protein A2531_03260 [Candidatus Falkowbacteria bact